MMIVRPLIPEDLAALSDLAKKIYSETFGHSLTASDLALQLEKTRSEACFRSAMDSDTILIAVDEGVLAGYVHICDVKLSIQTATEEDGQINALYVDSAFQGRGVGKMLMDAALKHPRLQAAENIYLDVWEENVRALEFYKRHGFEISGTCDVIIDNRIIGNDLVMVRRTRE